MISDYLTSFEVKKKENSFRAIRRAKLEVAPFVSELDVLVGSKEYPMIVQTQTDRQQLDRMLRRKEVEQITARSRSAIYEGMAAGTFPRSVKIGARAVA